MNGGAFGVLVTIVAVEGSAPRDAGTRMLVTPGRVLGTIGGGHLEYRSIETARAMLRDACSAAGGGDGEGSRGGHLGLGAPASALVERVALGPSLGQCCGGAVTLRMERISLAGIDEAALASRVAPDDEAYAYVFGAGHVGRALVPILASLPWRVVWIDGRREQIPEAPPPSVDLRITDDWEDEVASAPAQSHFVVMTHDHALDLAIVEAVLRRADFAYLGVIGSHTKRAKFSRRLALRGIAPHLLDAMRCPIGVAGVGGKSPGEIAVAVAAELLVVRGEAARAMRVTRSDTR